MHNNIRDRKLLDLAYQYPCMLQLPGICEGGMVPRTQPTEAWKGGAMKAHDLFPFQRVVRHIAFDQGIGMSRDERRDHLTSPTPATSLSFGRTGTSGGWK